MGRFFPAESASNLTLASACSVQLGLLPGKLAAKTSEAPSVLLKPPAPIQTPLCAAPRLFLREACACTLRTDRCEARWPVSSPAAAFRGWTWERAAAASALQDWPHPAGLGEQKSVCAQRRHTLTCLGTCHPWSPPPTGLNNTQQVRHTHVRQPYGSVPVFIPTLEYLRSR